jgi:hypothetical protein
VKVGRIMSKASCSMGMISNGLPNIQRQPDFTSNALTRKVFCEKINVDAVQCVYEPDPNQSLYKTDFLCSCVYTRMKFSLLPITPDDLLVTLCGNLYFTACKYVREESESLITAIDIGSIVHCSGV